VSKSKRTKAKDEKAKSKKGKGKKAKDKKSKAKKSRGKQAKVAGSVPQTVTPYLAIRDAARAIEFYREAFDALELMRLADPSGRIGHAEIEIGGARIMLADEHPEMNVRGPESFGGSPVSIHLYLEDVDAVFERAVAAGAKALREPADQFYGDRSATLIDPFGHCWFIATRQEVVPLEELEKRYAAITRA
jgi:PhnB protein